MQGNRCKYRPIMSDDRIAKALERIDAALARIEACEIRTASASDDSLVRRHQALRNTVEETLGELDALIMRLER